MLLQSPIYLVVMMNLKFIYLLLLLKIRLSGRAGMLIDETECSGDSTVKSSDTVWLYKNLVFIAPVARCQMKR